MFIIWLLRIGVLIGGFVAASPYIKSKLPKLTKLSDTLEKYKLYIGIVLFLISFVCIFSFAWVEAKNYPKLTLVAGLLTGIILSENLINNFNIAEEKKEKIKEIIGSIQIPVGIAAFIIGLIWIGYIVLDVIIKYLL